MTFATPPVYTGIALKEHRLGDAGVELRSAHREGWETHLADPKRYVEDVAS